MKITWSLPAPGERLHGTRGDVVRARRFVEALRHDGHEVRVVERAAAPATAAAVSAYRGVVRRVVPQRPALALRDAGRYVEALVHGRRVAAAAREQGADLIVETQVHLAGSGVLAARLTGLPLLLDDCSPSSEEQTLGSGFPGLAARVFRAQFRTARHLVVSSHALRARLSGEGVPAEKLHVVPNGVDADAYARIDRETVRQRLGLDGRCVIGFVGSFQPWHRVELLVKALAQLDPEPPTHLLLLGDGPQRQHVLDAVRGLGLEHRVTALGALVPEELPAYVAACDIGVVPASNDYGQPMKLMDYAAAGIPAIGPDLAPVREILMDGVTGLLVPAGDVPALAVALACLIRDPVMRTAMGTRARRIATEGSWRVRARQLAALAGAEQPAPAMTSRQ